MKNRLIERKAEAMDENAKEGNLEDDTDRSKAESMFMENCKHEEFQLRESGNSTTKSLKEVLQFVRFTEEVE